METRYQIVISTRLGSGMTELGRFFAGDDRTTAESIFSSLKGKRQPEHHPVLRMDLVERKESIDLVHGSISCTLAEYTSNCGTIARDVFKFHNMV